MVSLNLEDSLERSRREQFDSGRDISLRGTEYSPLPSDRSLPRVGNSESSGNGYRSLGVLGSDFSSRLYGFEQRLSGLPYPTTHKPAPQITSTAVPIEVAARKLNNYSPN